MRYGRYQHAWAFGISRSRYGFSIEFGPRWVQFGQYKPPASQINSTDDAHDTTRDVG